MEHEERSSPEPDAADEVLQVSEKSAGTEVILPEGIVVTPVTPESLEQLKLLYSRVRSGDDMVFDPYSNLGTPLSQLQVVRIKVREDSAHVQYMVVNLIIGHFLYGMTTTQAVEQLQTDHKITDIYSLCALSAGMSESSIRDCCRFYEAHNRSFTRLMMWIQERTSDGRHVSWRYCLNWLANRGVREARTQEERQDAIQHRVQKLEGRIMRADAEIDELLEEVKGTEDFDTVLGLSEASKQTIQSLIVTNRDATLDKPVRIRDEQFLDMVRRLPCVICLAKPVEGGANHPHHLNRGGTGTKGPDIHTVALCPEHHHELHTIPEDEFWQKYNIDRWWEVVRNLTNYFYLIARSTS